MRISDWSSDVCSSDLNPKPDRPCASKIITRLKSITSPKSTGSVPAQAGSVEFGAVGKDFAVIHVIQAYHPFLVPEYAGRHRVNLAEFAAHVRREIGRAHV